MTPERIAELREIANDRRYAWGVSSSTLTECLDEIERLQQALTGVPFPTLEIERIRREQMERDCSAALRYLIHRKMNCCPMDVVKAICQAFDEQILGHACKHADENYADLMRRLKETTDANDVAVFEEKE